MKIRPVGAKLFRADRQTDMTELIVSCLNSAKAPKDQQDTETHFIFHRLNCSVTYIEKAAEANVERMGMK